MLTSTTNIDRVLAEFSSVDEMEQELARLEGEASAIRARQVELLAGLDHLQVPQWDGTRSLKEWIAGRLDISPRSASDLAVLAKSELCWFHHHIVIHQHGYTIDPTSPPQRLRFLAPGVTRGPPAE